MKAVLFGWIVLGVTASCLGQALCPRHIEAPIYPVEARIASVQGNVTLTVVIGADGHVKHVEVADKPGQQAQQILQKSASDNVQHWTFEKPASASFTQVIVYTYRFDSSLPVDYQNPITKVDFDLPGYVTILANKKAIDTGQSKNTKGPG